MTATTVHTFYQSNIPEQLVKAQADVFAHLDIPLKQWCDDSTTHCDWINMILRDQSMGEIAVIADIDAFPLSRAGYDTMVDQARSGAVAGLAQVANHKDPTRLYAGPMFMAVQRKIYAELGSPSMCRSDTADVAQALTDRAQAAEIEVVLTYPAFSILPRWPLADHGVFGIGSFYGENAFFHLFEARRTQTQELFYAVANGVIQGRHDWKRYLEIMENAPAKPRKRKKFLGLF